MMLKGQAVGVMMVCFLGLSGLVCAEEPHAIARDLAVRTSQDAVMEEQQAERMVEKSVPQPGMMESEIQWIKEQVDSALTQDAPDNTGRVKHEGK